MNKRQMKKLNKQYFRINWRLPRNWKPNGKAIPQLVGYDKSQMQVPPHIARLCVRLYRWDYKMSRGDAE